MRLSYVLLALLLSMPALSVPLEYKFAERDTCDLFMDVYLPDSSYNREGVCVLYAFGGGFRNGSRKDQHTVDFMNKLADEGIVAIAMDYRLGFKGDVSELKPMKLIKKFSDAVNVAEEDMLSALAFVYNNREAFGIDSSKIVLAGSSAGAITALQCDYAISNGYEETEFLPKGCKPAGIISFAGAVCVFEGKLKYGQTPSPTMFMHGTADKLVDYDKFVLFGKGMFGSNTLARIFKKKNWPYWIMRFENFGHEISALPQIENIADILRFIDLFVNDKPDKQIDQTIREFDIDSPLLDMSVSSYKDPKYNVKADKYIERVNGK